MFYVFFVENLINFVVIQNTDFGLEDILLGNFTTRIDKHLSTEFVDKLYHGIDAKNNIFWHHFCAETGNACRQKSRWNP